MSFTVFLHASNGTQTVGGQRNDVQYNFDWGATPKTSDCVQEYEVTFSFVSFGTSPTTDDIFFPTVNWGATHDVYTPTLLNGAQTSTALGFVRQSTINTPASPNNGQYSSDITQNVPIRILGKPAQNQFTLRLLDIDGNLFAFGNVNYSMSIYFRTITTTGCMD
tara:strand:- start:752 stop:1243 length:492 start_codon:yes stop_codon:yes gene_type:complete